MRTGEEDIVRNLRCSFCRRDETQVAKLVAGPKVYICDRCVAIANQIMQHADSDPPRPHTVVQTRHPLVSRVRTAWRRLLRMQREWRPVFSRNARLEAGTP